MFDGLKEKLGAFRQEAEEVAAEKADEEAVAEEALGEDAATDEPAAPDAAVEGEGAAEDATAPDDGTAAEETDVAAEAEVESGSSEAVPEGGAGTAAPEAAEDEDGEADAEQADEEIEEAAEDADESAADDRGKASFTERARSLATGKVILDEEDLEGPLWDLEMALLGSDVEMSVAEEILDTIKADLTGERKGFTQRTSNVVADALRDALLAVIDVDGFDFEERIAAAEKPVVVVFTGVNGVGKTTTIAKLSRYLEERGYSTVLANGDTYRAGANEQIKVHADRLGTTLIHHEQGGDPAAVIYDAVEYAKAHDVDVVLGDTAGRLHTSHDLMSQLEKIDRVVGPDMTVFVDEAVAGQDAVKRAKEFDDAAEIDGSILTMADADAKGGAAISIAYVTGKPILFLGTGQDYDDLVPFDPERLVEDLLGE